MRALPLSLILAGPLVAQTGADGLPPARLPSTAGMDSEVIIHIVPLVTKVEKDKANGELHADLGLAYEANTCFPQAVQSYRNAVELLPDKPEWVYRLGVALVANGELDAALPALERAAAALKNTPVVQARLGALRFDLGDLEGAEAAWQQAIAAEAGQQGQVKYPQSRVGLAQVRYEQGRTNEAVALLQEALTLYPAYRHAHYLLGQCLYELGQDDAAEIELARGINAWPEFPPDPHGPRIHAHGRGHHQRMMVVENLMAQGSFDQAEAALRRTLNTRPNDPMVLNLLAKALQGLNRHDEAFEVLKSSEEADPTHAETHVLIAVALLNKSAAEADPQARQEIVGEAQGHMLVAVEIAPRQGRIRFFNGLAKFVGGDAQGAYNEMNLGLMLGCDEPQLYQHLTTLAAQMGRLGQMTEFAEKNVQLRPDDPAALQLLAQAYMTAKRYDDVEALFPRLLAFNHPQLNANVEAFRTAVANARAAEKKDAGGDDQ